MFNKSQDIQQKLQKYVIEHDGHQILIKLDVKHRWNSLATMISTFLKLKSYVNHTLLEFNLDTFSESEFKILDNVLNVLQPLNIAVNKFSSDTVTLLESEAILKFVFNTIIKSNSSFAQILLLCLRERISQRRNITLNTLFFIFT